MNAPAVAKQSVALIRYDEARRALAECCSVDEARMIRNRAVALQEYAKQAKDGALIEWAMEIRLRAERKTGEILRHMALKGERAARGTAQKFHGETFQPPKLDDLGVTKTQSFRWRRLAELSDDEFSQKLADSKREALSAMERTRAERLAEKQDRRAAREADLGAKQRALPDKKYAVILADPEWRFEPWSRETGLDRSPDNHYPTSCLEVIAARDVASVSADDSGLLLWATVPMLPHALIVMGAWGFDYRSHIVWTKDRAGTGYWFRNKHELLLLGVRGDLPCPAPGQQWESVLEAALARHSEKPEVFLELIEEYFPNLPKIELNRRGPPRAGWDAWGLEAET